jgi:hypothetical protein
MQDGPLSTRARIAILIYSMINAVLFGIGIVTVLNVQSLSAHLWIGRGVGYRAASSAPTARSQIKLIG